MALAMKRTPRQHAPRQLDLACEHCGSAITNIGLAHKYEGYLVCEPCRYDDSTRAALSQRRAREDEETRFANST